MAENEELTQEQQQEETSSDRIDRAFEAFRSSSEPDREQIETNDALWNGEEREETSEEVEEEEEEKKPEEEEKPEEEDRTEYYARMVRLDRENRKLKNELKALQGNGSNDIMELAKSDPMAALGRLGISIDDVLSRWAGMPPSAPEEVEDESSNNSAYSSKELEQLKEQLKELRQEQEHARLGQMVNQEFQKIDALISSSEDPDRWSYVREMKSDTSEPSYKLVLDTAKEIWKNTGEVPPYENVLDLVEKYYDDQFSSELERLEKIEKLRKKRAAFKTLPEAPKPKPKPSPTLSSSRTSDTPVTGSGGEKERFNRALEVLTSVGD